VFAQEDIAELVLVQRMSSIRELGERTRCVRTFSSAEGRETVTTRIAASTTLSISSQSQLAGAPVLGLLYREHHPPNDINTPTSTLYNCYQNHLLKGQH
jgi:hypothetical protein